MRASEVRAGTSRPPDPSLAGGQRVSYKFRTHTSDCTILKAVGHMICEPRVKLSHHDCGFGARRVGGHGLVASLGVHQLVQASLAARTNQQKESAHPKHRRQWKGADLHSTAHYLAQSFTQICMSAVVFHPMTQRANLASFGFPDLYLGHICSDSDCTALIPF